MQKVKRRKKKYLNSTSNPAVIIEILSSSTKSYDRGAKFRLYQDIPTLREYVMVDSESIHAEVYRKTITGEWELQEYRDLQQLLEIKYLEFSVSMSDVYEDVNL